MGIKRIMKDLFIFTANHQLGLLLAKSGSLTNSMKIRTITASLRQRIKSHQSPLMVIASFDSKVLKCFALTDTQYVCLRPENFTTLHPATSLGGEAEDLISPCPCLSICFFFVFFWPKQDSLIKHFPSLTGHMTVYPWELSHEVERGMGWGEVGGKFQFLDGGCRLWENEPLMSLFLPILGAAHQSRKNRGQKKYNFILLPSGVGKRELGKYVPSRLT